jgi:hypothetical protein
MLLLPTLSHCADAFPSCDAEMFLFVGLDLYLSSVLLHFSTFTLEFISFRYLVTKESNKELKHTEWS